MHTHTHTHTHAQVLEKENSALRRELRALKETQERDTKYRRACGVERELEDATEEVVVLRRHIDALKEELLESQRSSTMSLRALEDGNNWRKEVARELVARAEEKGQVCDVCSLVCMCVCIYIHI